MTDECKNEEVSKWLTVAGRWTFQGQEARYNGPRQGPVPLGIALSDKYARDAIIEVGITFEADQIAGAHAGVLLGYQDNNAEYVAVGLGGYQQAYTLTEYAPNVAWRALRAVGAIGDLATMQEYQLRVILRGQQITMFVDGIRLFEHVLPRPLSGNQLGLFAFGAVPSKFRNMRVQQTKARLFVAMQFSEPFDTLYREVIMPTAQSLGFQVVRIDEVTGPGIIFQDIQREIAEAKVIVAEISYRDPQKKEPYSQNPNVMYELGYAHGLNKPTVLLARRGCDLPFDIRSYRVVFYDDSIGGKPEAERNLTNHLRAILNEL